MHRQSLREKNKLDFLEASELLAALKPLIPPKRRVPISLTEDLYFRKLQHQIEKADSFKDLLPTIRSGICPPLSPSLSLSLSLCHLSQRASPGPFSPGACPFFAFRLTKIDDSKTKTGKCCPKQSSLSQSRSQTSPRPSLSTNSLQLNLLHFTTFDEIDPLTSGDNNLNNTQHGTFPSPSEPFESNLPSLALSRAF